jgi:hypothetical protein
MSRTIRRRMYWVCGSCLLPVFCQGYDTKTGKKVCECNYTHFDYYQERKVYDNPIPIDVKYWQKHFNRKFRMKTKTILRRYVKNWEPQLELSDPFPVENSDAYWVAW